MRETLTPAELAEKFGCHESYVQKQARSGEWPCHRLGRRIVFFPDDVETIKSITAQVVPEPPRIITRETLRAIGVTPRSAAIHSNRSIAARLAWEKRKRAEG